MNALYNEWKKKDSGVSQCQDQSVKLKRMCMAHLLLRLHYSLTPKPDLFVKIAHVCQREALNASFF